MQHISGYNLIQGAIGCSVASPLGAAKSGMKRLHAQYHVAAQRTSRIKRVTSSEYVM